MKRLKKLNNNIDSLGRISYTFQVTKDTFPEVENFLKNFYIERQLIPRIDVVDVFILIKENQAESIEIFLKGLTIS